MKGSPFTKTSNRKTGLLLKVDGTGNRRFFQRRLVLGPAKHGEEETEQCQDPDGAHRDE